MIIEVTKGEYAVIKRVLDEAYMLGEKIVAPLMATALMCAPAVVPAAVPAGLASPEAKVNSILGHINTVDGNGTSLYKQYNTNKADSKTEHKERANRKLLFTTIVQRAQQKNIPIAKAATIVKNELSAGDDSYNQLMSFCIKSSIKIGTIVTTTDQFGEEIVIVNFSFNGDSWGLGRIKMENSELVIPATVTQEH